MNKKTIILLVTAGLFLLLVLRFAVNEYQGRQAAQNHGESYVHKQYTDNQPLKVTDTCHPFFGSGAYELIIQNSSNEKYYLSLMLSRDNHMIWIEDLTKEARQGDFVFPCGH